MRINTENLGQCSRHLFSSFKFNENERAWKQLREIMLTHPVELGDLKIFPLKKGGSGGCLRIINLNLTILVI